MQSKVIIISKGFHSPWNMGEVVLARNFAKILMGLYDDVSLFSTVDVKRGLPSFSEAEGYFNVRYFYDEEKMKASVLRELNDHSLIEVHFINASLMKFLSVIRKARRVYLYQFAYNIFNKSGLVFRSVGALPLTYLGNVKIITTALNSYRRLHRLFPRHYYYVPAPIDAPRSCEKVGVTDRFDDYKLKVLYLGHGSYLRFPYDIIVKVISRLKDEGYRIELNIYESEQGYAKYMEFFEGFKRIVEKLGLEEHVKLHLGNLSEAEKWRTICKNDVLIFPSLTNAAIDPPLVVLEAMFMGKTVVATNVQSIPYLLGENRGIIVDRRNIEIDIYRALKGLATDQRLLAEYGANSKEWATRIHSMNLVSSIMARILSKT